MHSTEVQPAAGRRRRAEPTGFMRSALARIASRQPARFDSWCGAVWTIVIALDFYWLSNPLVFQTYPESLHDAWVATLVGAVLTLWRFQLPRPSWTVLAVLAFGFASAFWSVTPDLTVDFTTDYLIIAIMATVIAANADARTVAQGLMLGGVIIFALSIYALQKGMTGAAVPAGNTGFLAGVGTNRNILAYSLVISLAFAFAFVPRRWWARVLWAAGTGFSIVGACLTQSGTGIAAALILVVAGVALAATDRNRRTAKVRSARRRWSVRAGVVLALAVGVLGLDLLLRALGRDYTTLSGRVPLWEATWHATTGVDRWIGAGWGAVWPHPWHPARWFNPAHAQIIELSRYPALPHGHSSVFDLIPEIGVVGVAVFVLVYIQAVSRAFRLRDPRRAPTPERLEASRATLLGVLALVLFGLTEPMSTIPIGWFVIVLLATGLAPAAAATSGRRVARRRRRTVSAS